nr:classical arabinogalactan protein 9-like [Aegilops tauschii subsp. strangulata]
MLYAPLSQLLSVEPNGNEEAIAVALDPAATWTSPEHSPGGLLPPPPLRRSSPSLLPALTAQTPRPPVRTPSFSSSPRPAGACLHAPAVAASGHCARPATAPPPAAPPGLALFCLAALPAFGPRPGRASPRPACLHTRVAAPSPP